MSSGQQQAQAVTDGAVGFSSRSSRSFLTFAGHTPASAGGGAGHIALATPCHCFMRSCEPTQRAQLSSQRIKARGLRAFLFGLASEASLSRTRVPPPPRCLKPPPACAHSLRRDHRPHGVDGTRRGTPRLPGWGVRGSGICGSQPTTATASLWGMLWLGPIALRYHKRLSRAAARPPRQPAASGAVSPPRSLPRSAASARPPPQAKAASPNVHSG